MKQKQLEGANSWLISNFQKKLKILKNHQHSLLKEMSLVVLLLLIPLGMSALSGPDILSVDKGEYTLTENTKLNVATIDYDHNNLSSLEMLPNTPVIECQDFTFECDDPIEGIGRYYRSGVTGAEILLLNTIFLMIYYNDSQLVGLNYGQLK